MTTNEVTDVKLSAQQKKEGYWFEAAGNNLLVWHRKNQVALLIRTADINKKVQDVVEKRRKELKEVEEKTGWKAD